MNEPNTAFKSDTGIRFWCFRRYSYQIKKNELSGKWEATTEDRGGIFINPLHIVKIIISPSVIVVYMVESAQPHLLSSSAYRFVTAYNLDLIKDFEPRLINAEFIADAEEYRKLFDGDESSVYEIRDKNKSYHFVRKEKLADRRQIHVLNKISFPADGEPTIESEIQLMPPD